MKQFITGPSVPSAQICINKSRLKLYHKETNPTYYLQKGQEFQIELFNPTSDTILAKIQLNGKHISQGGLVLRPGERVFLERYLDVARRFLFDTYEVANTAEVRKAIEDNGDFKVDFYKETRQSLNYYPPITSITLNTGWNPRWNYPYYNGGICDTSNQPIGTVTNTLSSAGPAINASAGSYNLSNSGNVTMDSTFTSSVNAQSNSSQLYDANNLNITASLNSPKSKSSFKTGSNAQSLSTQGLARSIETGRVEAGSHSGQGLEIVDKTFEYYAFHTIEYKMLPISQKINTIADINVKQYCGTCGHKLGKTDLFCSKCGRGR